MRASVALAHRARQRRSSASDRTRAPSSPVSQGPVATDRRHRQSPRDRRGGGRDRFFEIIPILSAMVVGVGDLSQAISCRCGEPHLTMSPISVCDICVSARATRCAADLATSSDTPVDGVAEVSDDDQPLILAVSRKRASSPSGPQATEPGSRGTRGLPDAAGITGPGPAVSAADPCDPSRPGWDNPRLYLPKEAVSTYADRPAVRQARAWQG
jgi:hypothetical protein